MGGKSGKNDQVFKMKRYSLYRLLDFPFIYSLSQKLLVPGAGLLLKKKYKQLFDESKGLILDVGCGPALTTPHPNGAVIGIDMNIYYIRSYLMSHGKLNFCRKMSDFITYGVVSSSEALPFEDDAFEESRCVGLLHHLSHASALLTIKEMIRCTHQDGRIVVFDNVWPRQPCFRPLAWLSRKLDRGKWVRTEEDLLELVSNACVGNYQYKRFTYSYTGLEALSVIIKKNEGV